MTDLKATPLTVPKSPILDREKDRSPGFSRSKRRRGVPTDAHIAATGYASDPTGQPRISRLDPQERASDIPGGRKEELLGQIHALRRYAAALVGNHADADDLVQETLKRALVYFDADRQIDNLRAYLFTILHNVRVDMAKKQARAGTQVSVDETTLVAHGASESDRFACHEVVEAMQRLSEDHRRVLLLVGVEGMSYRETAEVLKLPIGTVMSRLNRARAALREILEIRSELEFGTPD